MRYSLVLIISLICVNSATAQYLKVKRYPKDAIGGEVFTAGLARTNLSLSDREDKIYREIKKGNIPKFLIKLSKISHTEDIDGKVYTIEFYTTPDYLSIGNDLDNVYMPMTPILAQKVADLFNCSLPTKKMVDLIYANASIKLDPQPIPPSDLMTSIGIFIKHNDLLKKQLKSFLDRHNNSELTAGNKKDVIISNKIYTEATPKVVIYGWHKLDGIPIQPVYNKHTNRWVDYSHGIRLTQNKLFVNGKKTTIAKLLANPKLSVLLSDERVIDKPFYPITEY